MDWQISDFSPENLNVDLNISTFKSYSHPYHRLEIQGVETIQTGILFIYSASKFIGSSSTPILRDSRLKQSRACGFIQQYIE